MRLPRITHEFTMGGDIPMTLMSVPTAPFFSRAWHLSHRVETLDFENLSALLSALWDKQDIGPEPEEPELLPGHVAVGWFCKGGKSYFASRPGNTDALFGEDVNVLFIFEPDGCWRPGKSLKDLLS